jgi:catechol 2,3-dioxygenase-like lactoylglutathione lyase family enzyme
MTIRTHIILYVADQQRSCSFYRKVLNMEPQLDVPGMSEFLLGEATILGLMPEAGIKRLLGETLPDPASGQGIPRAELYLTVTAPNDFHLRAIAAGAKELSPLKKMNWGDEVAYSLDPDGHVLAFAGKSKT